MCVYVCVCVCVRARARACVLCFATGVAARQCNLVCCPSHEARCAGDEETLIVVDNIYVVCANW